MFSVLLIVLLQVAPVDIPPDLAEELEYIKKEQVAIIATQKTLDAEWAWLKAEDVHLQDTEELLERGIITLTNESDAFLAAVDAQKAEAAKQRAFYTQIEQLLNDQQSRCKGSFDDQAYVDACNSELATLLAKAKGAEEWGERVNKQADYLVSKGEALDKQRNTIDQINQQLYADQLERVNRADALDENLDKLEVRKQKLSDRSNEALRRLAEARAVSDDCAKIAKDITADSCKGRGDPSDPANWNTPCELAARCLQRVWDGAR